MTINELAKLQKKEKLERLQKAKEAADAERKKLQEMRVNAANNVADLLAGTSFENDGSARVTINNLISHFGVELRLNDEKFKDYVKDFDIIYEEQRDVNLEDRIIPNIMAAHGFLKFHIERKTDEFDSFNVATIIRYDIENGDYVEATNELTLDQLEQFCS